MIRFALIVASTLGFFLTAAMGNLMVPLLRSLQTGTARPRRSKRRDPIDRKTLIRSRNARPSHPPWGASA